MKCKETNNKGESPDYICSQNSRNLCFTNETRGIICKKNNKPNKPFQAGEILLIPCGKYQYNSFLLY